MKVICIDAKPNPNFTCPLYAKNYATILQEGKVYTVSEIKMGDYNLVEAPHPDWPFGKWAHERFIPLSEIDETELVNQFSCDGK